MSAPPRIAVLTPYGASQQLGGVEVFNECLRGALGNLHVFADGLPSGPTPYGDFRRVGLAQPVGALRAARVLLRHHRREPFDLILSNGVYGWPLTVARPGVPLVQVYHFTMAGLARHALSLRGDRWTTGHVTALFDRVAGMGKHVVAISPRVLREVQAYYGLKGRIIPHAVDTDAFRPLDRTSSRRSLGLPERGAIGLFVGRPDPTKGYDILLSAARELPEVLFLVAGAPAAREGNVWSIGHVDHDAMPLWYSACDFFFAPSRYEGFGLALLEALSCDVPAVVNQSSWPFVEGPEECGVVVQGESYRDFVSAVRDVLAGPERFSPRQFVLPRYDLRVFQETWRGFIEGVLAAS